MRLNSDWGERVAPAESPLRDFFNGMRAAAVASALEPARNIAAVRMVWLARNVAAAHMVWLARNIGAAHMVWLAGNIAAAAEAAARSAVSAAACNIAAAEHSSLRRRLAQS